MSKEMLHDLYRDYLSLEKSLASLEDKREELAKVSDAESKKSYAVRDKIKDLVGLNGKATLIDDKIVIMISGTIKVFDVEEEDYDSRSR